MSSEVLADSFAAFLHDEFLRNCREPYDDVLVDARRAIGDIKPSEHVVYVPSPLLSGTESAESLMKMDAIAAMIANGDLAMQLADQPQARPVKRIEYYADERERGRSRLRVIWS